MASLDTDRFRRSFVLLLVLGVSAAFVVLIWPFIKPLFLAAVFSGLLSPVYRRLVILFRGRQRLASVLTIGALFLLVVGPLTGFFTLIAKQAIDISEQAIPAIEIHLKSASTWDLDAAIHKNFPIVADFLPDKGQLLEKLGELVQGLGKLVVSNVSKITAGAAGFFLALFVMLYAMYFFLIDGRKMLDRLLYLTPLGPEEEGRMVERFTSITRATVKGTLVIGVVQGALGGLGFYFAGLNGAAFWGTIMAILSIIPALGTAIVWIPGVVFLMATGHTTAGVILALYCAAIVGTADNLLRPILVGKDTEMPDLMVLIGTLGGIFLFGMIGIILGPIICGILLTVWDIYAQTFKEALPETDKSWQKRIPEFRKRKRKPKSND